MVKWPAETIYKFVYIISGPEVRSWSLVPWGNAWSSSHANVCNNLGSDEGSHICCFTKSSKGFVTTVFVVSAVGMIYFVGCTAGGWERAVERATIASLTNNLSLMFLSLSKEIVAGPKTNGNSISSLSILLFFLPLQVFLFSLPMMTTRRIRCVIFRGVCWH